ncbi:hypothetical protein NMG60_11032582 [Bertholletia excelsa]
MESHEAWATIETDLVKVLKEAEGSMREAEAYLYSVMESATAELRQFESELGAMGEAEMSRLVDASESAWREAKATKQAAIASHKSSKIHATRRVQDGGG